MKRSLVALMVLVSVVVIVFIGAKPLFGARVESIPKKGIEYKIVLDLGKRTTISKMEKALDSFVEQQKEKAILEIDLKKLGDEGWELVYFERETSFAIFKRVNEEKK